MDITPYIKANWGPKCITCKGSVLIGGETNIHTHYSAHASTNTDIYTIPGAIYKQATWDG